MHGKPLWPTVLRVLFVVGTLLAWAFVVALGLIGG